MWISNCAYENFARSYTHWKALERTVVTDVTPDAAKIRILWSTKDSRQYQMLASYDQVLIAVARAIDNFGTATQQRSAA